MLWTTRSETEQGLREELDVTQRLLALSTMCVAEERAAVRFERILDTALVLAQADAASLQVLIPERDELELAAELGLSRPAVQYWARMPASDAFIRAVIPDLGHARLTAHDRALLEQSGIRAWQATPLVSRKGELLGAIATHWCSQHVPDARELGRMDLLARQVADMLERTRNEEALRRASSRDAFRVTLSDALRGLADPRAIAAASARALGEHLGASRVFHAELAADRCRIGEHYCATGVPSIAGEYPCAASALAPPVRAGQTVARASHHADGAPTDLFARLLPARRAASIAVPRTEDGAVVAMLIVQQREPRTWTSDEIALVEETAERTWSALALARAQAEIVTNEARLRLALEAADLGTWVIDFVHGITVTDASFNRILGFPAVQTTRSLDTCIDQVHPDDLPIHNACWREALETGTYAAEYRLLDASGQPRWGAVRGKLVRDAAGTPKQVYGVTHDITARKQLEHALRENDQRKDQFLATLAHELRNPLAPILTGLEVIRICDNRDMRERMRTIIEEQSQQLVRLVDDLLDVGRITTGKLQLDKAELDLASVVHTAVATTAPAFEAARHELVVRLPDDPILIDGDRTRLAQVLTNLLTNAVRYTPAGGRIVLSATQSGDDAVIAVADNGVGIAPDMLERVFEMFVQGSEGEGLGIGLSLVKSLVELHGGRASARSEGLGLGSVFEVRLPRAQPHEPLPVNAGDGASSGRRRVLVADDNREVLMAHALLLRLLGHEVHTATDGRAALELAEQCRPDVILMDLGMPKLDGFAAARALRDTAWGAQVQLIAVSGWGQERDRRRAQEAGFDAHVIKPVDAKVLRELLRDERRLDAH